MCQGGWREGWANQGRRKEEEEEGKERVEERGWRSEGGGVRVEELEIYKLSHYLLQVVL